MIKSKYFDTRTECPVCKSKATKTIYELPFSHEILVNYLDNFYIPQGGVEHQFLKDTTYRLRICETCSLVYQQYIPNEDLMYRLYEQWIDPAIVRKHQDSYPLWYYETYANQLINIISFIDKKPNEIKILDFGMGWGKWCLMAKAFGCEVYGVELSPSRIEYALKNGINILEYDNLQNHRFDFINMDQVLEHLTSPLETIKYLAKCVADNGILKVSVPNGNDVEKKLNKMDWKAIKGSKYSLNIVAPLEHINCFKEETILNLMKQINMLPIEVPNCRKIVKPWKTKIRRKWNMLKGVESQSLTMFFKK